MNSSSGERNPVELLAEDFLDRKRRGCTTPTSCRSSAWAGRRATIIS